MDETDVYETSTITLDETILDKLRFGRNNLGRNMPWTKQHAWAFYLKQQLNEIQQQQAGLVDVDTLEKRMDKLSLTVENSVEKLEHDTEVGQKEGSGNGYDSGTGASKGSTSGKDSNSPRNSGHDVDDKIDIIKISKRAANLAKLENGVYKGVGDKRGYLAFKREVLSKPEFEFADSTSEISCALLYFYVLDNITAALQQLVSTRCRKQNCSTFVERVVVLWNCLGEYSDLDDQMALIRRWERLSCGPGGSAQVDSFISDLEGVKEQLESIRGMPLTDVECRSRLYSGLPSEGKEYLDSLSLESVATYADMPKETRRWAQLDIRYHFGTTNGVGSRGSSG
ncbi:hypothetical protein FOL47_001371 [Perkinsus chesapeaki]|uniref:Uncharacterized protein n=1 Tax=Perkinsus chesapeaki TaxID=330153 RepID=A0A7J6KTL2_PERCH|nr:hypothetical protein FOL47_001371 [Perkinsus chesapeaki]